MRCLLVGEFNLENLAGLLRNDDTPPRLDDVILAPYGQTVPTLIDPAAECWHPEPDLTVVWTLPEQTSPSFARLLEHDFADVAQVEREVAEFCDLLREASRRTDTLLVVSWTQPARRRGLGLLDARPGVGATHALWRMNCVLSERLQDCGNVFVLPGGRWQALAGPKGSSAKLWFMGKIPFGPSVFAEATQDIKAAARAIRGMARKLVIVDLDDTLWGGVVGDVGWENLVLGGHDPEGEAYVAFQRGLKALARRGVVLGIVSKNEEDVALEAIDRHPEMVLRLDDFVGWRIDWSDKAAGVASLTDELNLGLASVVFIDDSPVERARVAEALPEVAVPDWPRNPLSYADALASLPWFDTAAVTSEDSNRTSMYVAERNRRDTRATVGSMDEWLKSLEVVVTVEPLSEVNLPRTAQLLNKTNQFNLHTRRLSERELLSWSSEADNEVWVLRVADRFGDSGLTGIVSLSLASDTATVEDFVLSCRVMGKKVEETMLHVLVTRAGKRGAGSVEAVYLPTPKNVPCLKFFRASAFSETDENRFVWNLGDPYDRPDSVELTWAPSPPEALP